MNSISTGEQGREHPAGFSRRYRLTGTDDFSSVFSFRKAIRGQVFLLHYRPHAHGQPARVRLGLVVAKRLLRRSVDRNLVRRLAREAFRIRRQNLPMYDLIVRLAAKPSLPIDRRALTGEIHKLLDKLPKTGDRP